MKTISGTNYFTSVYKAAAYYVSYGLTKEDVLEKIKNKEIEIGKPEEKEGREIFLNGKEGRYFIEE